MSNRELTVQVESHQIAEPEAHLFVRRNASNPTEEVAQDFNTGFGFLNERLFDNRLALPIMQFVRKKNMLGAFKFNRYASTDGRVAHEILLNPEYLPLLHDFDVLSVLSHQMGHQFREEYGPPPRRQQASGYHDEAFAEVMEARGVITSSTGAPGGKRTGAKMLHYVVPDGPFDLAARELLASGFGFRWRDLVIEPQQGDSSDRDDGANPRSRSSTAAQAAKTVRAKKKDDSKTKFTCWGCGLNAWSKPSASLKCAPCDLVLLSSESVEGQEKVETKALTIVR